MPERLFHNVDMELPERKDEHLSVGGNDSD
jgi:hypothetical protein